MTHRTLLALSALPLVLVPVAALAAESPALERSEAMAPAPDLDAMVAEEARAASDRTLEEIWQRAFELRDAAALGEEGDLDRVLDRQLNRPERLSPEAAILLSASRLQGDDVDAVVLLSALEPLIALERDDVARAAASLFGSKAFRSLNRARRNELVDNLLEAAQNTGRAPEYRLDFAMAAYRLGGGSSRRAANEIMTSFLQSEDAELRAQGALALATATERDINGKLRDVLERLAQVPDDRGRLAASYLELEDERVYNERKLRDVRDELNEDKLPPEFEELVEVRKLISRSHLEGDKVSDDDLISAAIDGMLRWMDPHSNYLSSEAYAKFFQDLEAEYGGIGAYVRDDRDTGLFTIVRPIYSGPAYEAGLMTDDKIVKIDDWPTLGQPEGDIIKRLKGKPGTPVELYVWRRGMDPELIDRPTEDMKVIVERAEIEIPAGSNQLLPGGIGLIELTTFSKRSQAQMTEWIDQMKKDGMRALILDMRRNSGGLLTEAREVADLFLPAGKVVVKTESREGEPEFQRTHHEPIVPPDFPIVILTSRMTASAAEIVSGALQDYGRAQLVGRRTYGKGSVQQLLPILPERQDIWDETNDNYRWDEGERILIDRNHNGEVDHCPRVKLTIARYLLPSGRSIHREVDREGNLISEGGVKPDLEVELPSIERWRYDERERLRRSEVLKEYLDHHYNENRELFQSLAVNDLKDPSLYPDFDALVVALSTTASRDDVRDVLRREIRRRVQDDLGHEFPYGDFVEDLQVQKAVELALNELGESVDDITEYGLVFDFEEHDTHDELAILGDTDRPRLNRVRTLLEDARKGDAVLNDESLEELLSLIDEIEDIQEN